MTKDIEAVASDIVDSAFKVHQAFGPGCLNQHINNAMPMNFASAVGKS